MIARESVCDELHKEMQKPKKSLSPHVCARSYRAPEVILSCGVYDEAIDIWSLGCIIYEIMTLSQPFSASNPLSIAKKIVDGEYTPIPDDYYSPLLLDTVKKCMTADQNYRPNITEICQLMVDVLMAQLDFMREKDNLSSMEIKQLKERLKSFEGPTTTGFKGFSTSEAQ